MELADHHVHGSGSDVGEPLVDARAIDRVGRAIKMGKDYGIRHARVFGGGEILPLVVIADHGIQLLIARPVGDHGPTLLRIKIVEDERINSFRRQGMLLMAAEARDPQVVGALRRITIHAESYAATTPVMEVPAEREHVMIVIRCHAMKARFADGKAHRNSGQPRPIQWERKRYAGRDCDDDADDAACAQDGVETSGCERPGRIPDAKLAGDETQGGGTRDDAVVERTNAGRGVPFHGLGQKCPGIAA